MKDQHSEQQHVKIIQLQARQEKTVSPPANKIGIALLVAFFICLSIISNQIFLKEILIASGIIGLTLLSKEATSSSK